MQPELTPLQAVRQAQHALRFMEQLCKVESLTPADAKRLMRKIRLGLEGAETELALDLDPPVLELTDLGRAYARGLTSVPNCGSALPEVRP